MTVTQHRLTLKLKGYMQLLNCHALHRTSDAVEHLDRQERSHRNCSGEGGGTGAKK